MEQPSAVNNSTSTGTRLGCGKPLFTTVVLGGTKAEAENTKNNAAAAKTETRAGATPRLINKLFLNKLSAELIRL